jgi:hypothetical protein
LRSESPNRLAGSIVLMPEAIARFPDPRNFDRTTKVWRAPDIDCPNPACPSAALAGADCDPDNPTRPFCMARMRLLAEKRDELTPELVPHVAKHNLVMTYRRPGGTFLGSARNTRRRRARFPGWPRNTESGPRRRDDATRWLGGGYSLPAPGLRAARCRASRGGDGRPPMARRESGCVIQGCSSCSGVVPSAIVIWSNQPHRGSPGRPVKPGDVGLEVDDGCPVEKVDPGESDGPASYLQKLDKAETDRVDPPRPAGGEDAHPALLAAEQERDLPQRRVAAGVARAVQPGD